MKKLGRKPGADGEKRKLLLLEAAAEEFSINGYHATKISTIVKKAEVTQPAFYLYFRSKEAIFNELVSSFRDQLFTLIDNSQLKPALEHASLADAITAKVASIFTFFTRHPQLTIIGLQVSSEAAAIQQEMAERISNNLKVEQQLGYFRQDVSIDVFAESLVGTMHHFALKRLVHKTAVPENLAADVVSIYLHGIITRETLF